MLKYICDNLNEPCDKYILICHMPLTGRVLLYLANHYLLSVTPFTSGNVLYSQRIYTTKRIG